MGIVRIALLLGLVGLGVHLCGREASTERSLADKPVDAVSANGFVTMPRLSGAPAGKVVIFAPKNCPSAAARRADAIARALAHRGIPAVRLERADFEFDQVPDAAIMRRINTVVGGEMPVVFVNGRAKTNPMLEDVVAEYRRDRSL